MFASALHSTSAARQIEAKERASAPTTTERKNFMAESCRPVSKRQAIACAAALDVAADCRKFERPRKSHEYFARYVRAPFRAAAVARRAAAQSHRRFAHVPVFERRRFRE